MGFQFQYPLAFWLLLLVPVLVIIYLLYITWRKRSIKKIGEPKLIAQLLKGHSPLKTTIKFTLLAVAFALGILALANPRKRDDNVSDVRKGIDVVIALDVSNSMLATDIAPNRLARAKQFITKLFNKMPDDRIGLVVFAGHAYVQMPLTTDHNAARMFVQSASPQLVKAQGTAIDDALKKAEGSFNDESPRFRSIIVISDGETHDETALQTVTQLANKGIMVNTVGIGSIEGTTIVDPSGFAKKDESGNLVISKLNEQLLQRIAAATNGEYLYLESTDDAVNKMAAQLSQIEKKAFGDSSMFTYKTFYLWLVLPMFLLLLAELFMPDKRNILK